MNGRIPISINKLRKLEWVNLEYNYLSGVIPEGFSKLKNLRELLLNGNFIVGPVPADLVDFSRGRLIDLSQNVIKENDRQVAKMLNILKQVNLEGCRSPDSIYLSKVISTRIPTEANEISIDTGSIKTESIKNSVFEKIGNGDVKKPAIEKIVDRDVKNKNAEDLFKLVERMPRFPGCELSDLTLQEKENCAKEAMLEFIYKNLRYPSLARDTGTEGMAVVQFVVQQDGSIADVKIVRDPGTRIGNSGLWIVNRMNYICDKWTPGIQRGRPVKVLYTLPIKFKLS